MFNDEKIYLAEAPTGTGKSLAYLIPCFIWAQRKKTKIVISSHTIHLQEQLLKKDVALVNRLFKNSLTPLVVKGKNNFLCYKKYREYHEEPTIFPSLNDEQSKKILEWAKETQTGDKNELNFIPQPKVWKNFSCENEFCRVSQCQFKSQCFQIKNRKKIAEADVLITNHHLLSADAKIKNDLNDDESSALLPPYEGLIIDEAHHLEEVVRNYFTKKTSIPLILKTINDLAKFSKNGKLQSGLFKKIEIDFKIPQSNFKILWEEFIKSFYNKWSWFSKKQSSLTKKINHFIIQSQRNLLYRNKINAYFNHTFLKIPHYKSDFAIPLEKLYFYLEELYKVLVAFFQWLKKLNTNSLNQEWLITTLSEQLHKIKESLSIFYFFLSKKNDDLSNNFIPWVSLEKKPALEETTFYLTPFHLADLLRKNLFKTPKSILLTSATLSINNNFNFISEQLGLNNQEQTKVTYESLPYSFDYQRNCLMFVPKQMPSINDKDFLAKSLPIIVKVINFLKGKTLILFTSEEQLRKYQQQLKLKEKLLSGITVISQGDLPQFKLIETFKQNANCVILGLASFWEGIDIPGENLSALIIMKLPFPYPTEPTVQARMQELERQGKNSFKEYLLPQAILRFKQGFGRLIRSDKDKGIFIVLDNRLLNKSYGKSFFQALPQMPLIIDNLKKVLDFL